MWEGRVVCGGVGLCVWGGRAVCVGVGLCVWEGRAVCVGVGLCVWGGRAVCGGVGLCVCKYLCTYAHAFVIFFLLSPLPPSLPSPPFSRPLPPSPPPFSRPLPSPAPPPAGVNQGGCSAPFSSLHHRPDQPNGAQSLSEPLLFQEGISVWVWWECEGDV